MKELDLAISCNGNALRGRVVVPGPVTRSIVLLHGIPSVAPPDPGDPGYPGLARSFAERGWVAAWADMRGVRSSAGFFSIEGWVADVDAIVTAVRDAHPTEFLALVGSSAGGAVAVEAVSRGLHVDALGLLAAPAAWLSFAADPAAGVHRVTVEAGMRLAPDAVADPAAWAAEFDRVVPQKAIAAVDAPILVLHGDADEVVPVDHARLLGTANPSATVHVIEGGTHQLRRDPRALGLLSGWLDRVSGAR